MSQPKSHNFAGTALSIVSGFGTAVAITGLTNANPAVVTQVAHGYTGPTVVKLAAVGGMTEVNGNLYVIDPLTADTYSLVGVDSLNWGTYTSNTGTAAPATWASSCEITQYADNTGATPSGEIETNCGTAVSLGQPLKGSLSLAFMDAETVFQETIRARRLDKVETAFKISKPGYAKTVFDVGNITNGPNATGSAGGKYTGSASMQRTQHQARVE